MSVNNCNVSIFSNDKVYDVIIVGSGLSGLQCGSSLLEKYGVNKSNLLVLEAQDYVGGRVKQDTEFIKGVKLELGAECLHGSLLPFLSPCRHTNS
jgi:monoamine oxidase